MWIAEAGEELVPCQQILTTHNRFFHPYLLRATEFLVEPSAESLRYKFYEYKNLPPWQQSKKAQMNRRDGNKRAKNVSGLTARESPTEDISAPSLCNSLSQQNQSHPFLKPLQEQMQKINACSRVVPRSPPTYIRRLQRALHLAGWGLWGLGGEIPLYGWRWMTAIWALVPCCEGWQGCCLSCSGQFLQWYHYPSAIWQA